MFDVVLNTPFICNGNQLTGFYLIQIFTEKLFSIPQNMFKLYAKKIYTKYDKICLFEKNPHKDYHRKEKY